MENSHKRDGLVPQFGTPQVAMDGRRICGRGFCRCRQKLVGGSGYGKPPSQPNQVQLRGISA